MTAVNIASLPGQNAACNVEVIGTRAELAARVADWEDLVAGALEPNVFYEPWMLMPAIGAFGRNAQLLFVLIYAQDANNRRPLLCGFFPLEKVRGYKKLPFGTLKLWQHLHCFLCTPLLRKGYARACWQALYDWLPRNGGTRLIELNHIAGDGPVWQALQAFWRECKQPVFQNEVRQRALIQKNVDPESYIQETLSTGNRKELRRQYRRLSEKGELVSSVLDANGDIEQWIKDFMDLEAAGWKGQEETAIKQDADQRAWFETVCREAFRRQKLMMLKLTLAGKPIAMKCNFVSVPGSFSFKIAFDENYCKYSPGVQLELDNIRRLGEIDDVDWMDSCAVSNHFMINRLWKERRTIRYLLTSTGSAGGNWVVRTLPALRRFGRWLREE